MITPKAIAEKKIKELAKEFERIANVSLKKGNFDHGTIDVRLPARYYARYGSEIMGRAAKKVIEKYENNNKWEVKYDLMMFAEGQYNAAVAPGFRFKLPSSYFKADKKR